MPVASGGTGFVTPGSFGLPAVQRGFVTVDPGPVQAPALTGSFEVKAWFFHLCNQQAIVVGPAGEEIYFRVGSRLPKVKVTQFSPVVTVQPVSQRASAGASLTFTAQAVGNPAPTVDLQLSPDGGTTWVNGAPTSTSLVSSPLFSFENGWEVRAVFTNSLGTATSDHATIAVT